MTTRVVIAGGGTGGHIFPGLAVASELAALGVEVHWLGARRGLEGELVGEAGIPITLVDLEGMRSRGPSSAIRALAQVPRAVATSVRVLADLSPLAVLGVGGYASSAGLLAAGLLGIPAVLQEQNAIPGWTNRVLSPWADAICCGFADATSAFPSLPAEWTGNPVRADFFAIADPVIDSPPRLLMLGGSQGSLFLNRTVPRALARLADAEVPFTVRHQAGVRWAEVVRTSYQDLLMEAQVNAFLSEPWLALGESDLVVSRSGALTVSELAAAGRAAVLVPFAGASGNHQEYNARSIEGSGGAVVITEDEASPERLAEVLGDLLSDPQRLAQMGRSARAAALPDAARRIARRLLIAGGVA